jgi:hypothetical protein
MVNLWPIKLRLPSAGRTWRPAATGAIPHFAGRIFLSAERSRKQTQLSTARTWRYAVTDAIPHSADRALLNNNNIYPVVLLKDKALRTSDLFRRHRAQGLPLALPRHPTLHISVFRKIVRTTGNQTRTVYRRRYMSMAITGRAEHTCRALPQCSEYQSAKDVWQEAISFDRKTLT